MAIFHFAIIGYIFLIILFNETFMNLLMNNTYLDTFQKRI